VVSGIAAVLLMVPRVAAAERDAVVVDFGTFHGIARVSNVVALVAQIAVSGIEIVAQRSDRRAHARIVSGVSVRTPRTPTGIRLIGLAANA
jgi:hypothetical protein